MSPSSFFLRCALVSAALAQPALAATPIAQGSIEVTDVMHDVFTSDGTGGFIHARISSDLRVVEIEELNAALKVVATHEIRLPEAASMSDSKVKDAKVGEYAPFSNPLRVNATERSLYVATVVYGRSAVLTHIDRQTGVQTAMTLEDSLDPDWAYGFVQSGEGVALLSVHRGSLRGSVSFYNMMGEETGRDRVSLGAPGKRRETWGFMSVASGVAQINKLSDGVFEVEVLEPDGEGVVLTQEIPCEKKCEYAIQSDYRNRVLIAAMESGRRGPSTLTMSSFDVATGEMARMNIDLSAWAESHDRKGLKSLHLDSILMTEQGPVVSIQHTGYSNEELENGAELTWQWSSAVHVLALNDDLSIRWEGQVDMRQAEIVAARRGDEIFKPGQLETNFLVTSLGGELQFVYATGQRRADAVVMHTRLNLKTGELISNEEIATKLDDRTFVLRYTAWGRDGAPTIGLVDGIDGNRWAASTVHLMTFGEGEPVLVERE